MRTVAWCGGHIELLDQTLLQREVRTVAARGRAGARLAQAEGWPAGQLEAADVTFVSADRTESGLADGLASAGCG